MTIGNLENEEEAWFVHAINEFQYLVNSGKYGPHFYKFLTPKTKEILFNMYVLEQSKLELVCPSQSD